MTPAARTVALSLSLIQQKADRLREHDDLPKRAKTRRARAITCRARLDRTYQRYRYAVAVAGDLPAEHYAARRELRASIGSYRQALYELVAIAWIFAETAPNDRFAAYRLSDIDELQPSRIQHHLGELHHLLLRHFDLFVVGPGEPVIAGRPDSVEALLGEFDRLLGEFDELLSRTCARDGKKRRDGAVRPPIGRVYAWEPR